MTQKNERDNILQQSKKCLKCNKMYGNVVFNNMCSKCFKLQKINQPPKETQPLVQKPSLLSEPQKVIPLQKMETKSFKRQYQRQETEELNVKKGRCTICSKKTRMLGYECNNHRMPQDHNCSIDFISLGKKKIKQQNPLICVKKIEEI